MNVVARAVLNALIWADEGLNTLAGGSPNETVSERAAKAAQAGKRWGCVLCKALDWLDRGHCATALTSTIGDDAIVPDGE